MKKPRNPLCILTSDWHIQQRCPSARVGSDWIGIQAAYLTALCELQNSLDGVPVVVAGDVFDRWDSSVELVNWLIARMPKKVYGCAGQHDLSNHRYADMHRSAYWNLVESGKLINLPPDESVVAGKPGALVELFGFPWGTPPSPCPAKALVGGGARVRLAVVHRYVWARPEDNPARKDDESRVNVIGRAFDGYDAVLIGDNHTPWQLNGAGGRNTLGTVFNHGTALRRHADEKALKVGPGILYDDGTVERHELEMPPDLWADSFEAVKAVEPAGIDAAELLAVLKRGGDAVVSFRQAVRAIVETPPGGLSPGAVNELKGWVS